MFQIPLAMEANKKELRKKYNALRNDLTEKQIDKMSLAIANNVLKMNIWHHNYFHIYMPITEKKEVNTNFILNILHGKDKEIILSKSNFETLEMSHYLLTDNTIIKKNQYNIPEPLGGIKVPTDQIEVVFVPLLAYDKTGNRVGYGKGFYDKFLSQCSIKCVKIGLSFFEPELVINDIDSQDIKLDFCVNSEKIICF